MYTVVGCPACRAIWVVEDRPETTECRRCGKRHRFEKLRSFARTDTADAAARVRSSMLADRADDGAFVDPQEIDVEGVGMDDATFLSASGVDPDAVADAGKTDTSGSRSRKRILLDGLSELDAPTEAEVVEYATAAGVPEAKAERLLTKLRRAGEVTETDGTLRRL